MHLTGGVRGRTDPNTASSVKHTHSLTYSITHTFSLDAKHLSPFL